MQTTAPTEMGGLGRKIGYFFIVPGIVFVAFTLTAAFTITNYQIAHTDRIYTGVTANGVDLSEMTQEEAAAALSAAFAYSQETAIMLIDPTTGQSWTMTPGELGMTLDETGALTAIYDVGRQGTPQKQLRETFDSWYYGRSFAPVIQFDEGKLDAALHAIAQEIDQPAVNATLDYGAETANYDAGQNGRRLDIADAKSRLIEPLLTFQPIQLELLIHDVEPAVYDDPAATAAIQQALDNPMYFYLEKPLDDLDLGSVELPKEELRSWLRVEMITDENGVGQHHLFVDENAARHWLRQFEEPLYREPVRARFYFDDDTRELVLVSPHVNGREFDLEATVQKLSEQIGSANLSIPFVVNDIVPIVNENATAVDLGITELITETTTWFYGSTDARKHNIARSAANFYGIVVAPGEEFSFNKYLGSISEDDGYSEGLIIVGGRTIKGIGGGVCQVSTTLYQAAFLSGFPLTERLAHGYWLRYYNDGQGPGMDATVYTPLVDMKFLNNTDYHLLIENYYNQELEALTFKFYSTDLGRRVIKSEPEYNNVTDVPGGDQDIWEYDEDLAPGEVVQIDYATEGADVTIRRTVINIYGDTMIDENIVSNYIPYPNVYHYGPGVEPYDYSLVPPPKR